MAPASVEQPAVVGLSPSSSREYDGAIVIRTDGEEAGKLLSRVRLPPLLCCKRKLRSTYYGSVL